MLGTTPPTSQLDWLISTTAMIVLFWSRATRDLFRSLGWGIAALHRLDTATKLPSLAARPIASVGPLRAGIDLALGALKLEARSRQIVHSHNSPERFWSDPQTYKAVLGVARPARPARRKHLQQRVFGIGRDLPRSIAT